MKYEAASPEEYIGLLPEDRKVVMEKLRKTIKENLPTGFEETMSYGMIGYVVPFSIYPAGYKAKPSEPLPFINLASQKNFIALYHTGIYSSQKVLIWFQEEYPKHVKTKLDMGKGCIRFKNMDSIPYELIGELCRKISVEEYLYNYETEISKRGKLSKGRPE